VRDRSLLAGSLICLLAASGFGLLGPLARFAYDAGFDPFSFVAWRATFGLVVVVLVVAWRQNRGGGGLVNLLALPRSDQIGLVAGSLAGLFLNIAMFFAFGLVPIALALLAFYTYPALVAVVAVVLGHERLDGNRLTALALAVGGMVLVVAAGLDPRAGIDINPLGIGLALLAACFQTVFVTVSRGRFATVPAEQVIGLILVVTAVTCLALAVATGGNPGAPFGGAEPFALAAIAGSLGAGIPSILFLTGIRTIGGTRAGILMLFEPVVGATLAALLLHEGLAPIQVLGGGAILAAAVILQRGAKHGEQIEPLGVPSAERP
jgi:drug/metabolite transporter (DMT)-like permease